MPNKKIVKQKVVVILGTTSAGKTSLAVDLALDFKGEIIWADSRQVYKGLDIGTGKDLGEYKRGRKSVAHHLIDVADPRRQFNLSRYQKLTYSAIKKISDQGRLPFLVGGSGLYLQAIVENFNLPSGRFSAAQRLVWSKLSAAQLLKKITKLKPEFAERLNNSDKNNVRRLVRYLEIIKSGTNLGEKNKSPYDWLIIGVKLDESELKQKINQRLRHRLDREGLVLEVQRLRESGLSWKKLKSFGLEYKFVSQFLLAELPYELMVEKLETALWRFAKRQLVWFKRWEKQGCQIIWVKDKKSASRYIKKWLKKSP